MITESERQRRASFGATMAQNSLRKQRLKAVSTGTHGMHGSPTYRSWLSMKHRCLNTNSAQYGRYGGVGIGVFPGWANDFARFLSDMGPRPSLAHSLDRFPDGSGGYQPGNCRWATRSEQGRNKNTNRIIEWRGESKCVAAWAEELGIHRDRLFNRLSLGWSVERTLTQRVNRRSTRP